MTADGWQQVHSAIVKLWKRVHPGRAETIEAELSETREEALAALKDGDTELMAELAADWHRRLQRLLHADPDSAAELQHVLEEVINPVIKSTEQQLIGQITLKATASGHGRVYQAGHDQHIT